MELCKSDISHSEASANLSRVTVVRYKSRGISLASELKELDARDKFRQITYVRFRSVSYVFTYDRNNRDKQIF